MPETPVGAYIHEPLDVHRDLTPEIPFNPVVSLNGTPQLCDLLFSEILDADVRVHPGVLQDFAGSRATNAEDIRQRYLEPFFPRKIYPGDTCHHPLIFSSRFKVSNVERRPLNVERSFTTRLPLALFVPRIFTYDPQHPFPSNDLALLAYRLYRRSNLHDNPHVTESLITLTPFTFTAIYIGK